MPEKDTKLKEILFSGLRNLGPEDLSLEPRSDLSKISKETDLSTLTNRELVAYWQDPDFASELLAARATSSSDAWQAIQELVDQSPHMWRYPIAASTAQQEFTLPIAKGYSLVFEEWPQGWRVLTVVDDTALAADYKLEVRIEGRTVLKERIVREAYAGPESAGRRLPPELSSGDIAEEKIDILINDKPLNRHDQPI